MSTYTYKSISDLSSATNINNDDILLISLHNGEQLISKKTTVEKLVDDAVLPLMEDYLPLAAGPENVIDGTIYSSNPNATLRHNYADKPMRIIAGPYMSNSLNDWLPAELVLHHSGKADGTDKSQFELHVHRLLEPNNTKYTTTLRGTCNGKLTWDTKNIVRSVNGISAADNGNLNIDLSNFNIGLSSIPNLCAELNKRPISTGTIEYANKLKTARKISLIGDATGNSTFNGSTNISIDVNVLSSDYAQTSLSAMESDKLKTARTIKLSGDLSGSFLFNGNNDITANISVNNNSHTHTITNITNLLTELNNKIDKNDISLSIANFGDSNTIEVATLSVDNIKVGTISIPNLTYVISSGRFNSSDGTTHSDNSENNSWYRVYSDGWCELGGVLTNLKFNQTAVLLMLIKTYNDNISYNLSFGISIPDNASVGMLNCYAKQKIANSFNIYKDYAGTSDPNYICNITWEAKGFIKVEGSID